MDLANYYFDDDSFESLLNKATSPLNRNEDWEYIMGFCDKINTDLEGVLVATGLLLYKLKSPQEKEALQAVTVLEACVKNCGEQFQNAIGKNKFVDELVSIICQQHVMNLERRKGVQEKLINLLYIWSIALPDQINIKNAYQKLKKQGIVEKDPNFDPQGISNFQAKSKPDLFSTDAETRIQLQKLLKSKNPADHRAANRLIKNAVKTDDQKMDVVKKQMAIMEEVRNNVTLLDEMLQHYKPGLSAAVDLEIMKDLYTSCSNFRPVLFRTATNVSDEKLVADVLAANDSVSKVLQSYDEAMKKTGSVTVQKTENLSEPLQENLLTDSGAPLLQLDMSGMNLNAETSGTSNKKKLKPCSSQSKNDADETLIDLHASPSKESIDASCLLNEITTSSGSILPPLTGFLSHKSDQLIPAPKPKLNDLDIFGDSLMNDQLYTKPQPPEPIGNLLDGAKSVSNSAADTACADLLNLGPMEPHILLSPKPVSQPFEQHHASPPTNYSLSGLSVPLQSIRPSQFPPSTFYDKNGLRGLLYFAKDHVSPLRTDTLVGVVTMISTSSKPIRNIHFKVASPKTMKVKLQTPSSTELSVFNPLVSTPPSTQILIISNPSKEAVILRYMLDYNIDMQETVHECGLINGFPVPQKWGNL